MELLESQKLFISLKGLNKIKKELKIIQNLLSLKYNHFTRNSNEGQIFFSFFTEILTLSLPVTRCAGHNTIKR